MTNSLPAPVMAASLCVVSCAVARLDEATVVCRAERAAEATVTAAVVRAVRSAMLMVDAPLTAGRWPRMVGVRLADTAWHTQTTISVPHELFPHYITLQVGFKRYQRLKGHLSNG